MHRRTQTIQDSAGQIGGLTLPGPTDAGFFGYNRVQMQPSGEFEVEPVSQRMTHEEANAVVQLWQRQQSQAEAVQSLPTLGDLAEALKIPESAVADLLGQVRAKQALDRHRPEAPPVAQRKNLSAVVIAAAVFALCLLLALSFVFVRTVSTDSPTLDVSTTTVSPAPEAATTNATAPEAASDGVPPSGTPVPEAF
ncbi:MAG: hypothetical protein AMXMBFR81_03480 [Chthonomonas sp.]